MNKLSALKIRLRDRWVTWLQHIVMMRWAMRKTFQPASYWDVSFFGTLIMSNLAKTNFSFWLFTVLSVFSLYMSCITRKTEMNDK